MSALFNFHSFLTVVLLVICTCTYIKMQFPAILERKTGFRGFFWKAARIGERLSPWVAFGCFAIERAIFSFQEDSDPPSLHEVPRICLV
ncbi:hypothetical protein MUK42_32782 [Musa troglodytarum]|uniref:Protein kish n=1 Tax=Musa troglodytarum TaxID=320322 RepID=A0A9E7HYB1_9LILI|nr:hypothetical protein MUK42_32782 [Musa troglodytarum]